VKGAVGFYDTVRSKKYVDGKVGTFQSEEDYRYALVKESEVRMEEVTQAAALFGVLANSPTGSEEAAYTELQERRLFEGGLSSPKERREVVDGSKIPGTPRVKKETAKAEGKGLSDSPTLKHLAEEGGLNSAIVGMLDQIAYSVNEITKRIETLESGEEKSHKQKLKAHLKKEEETYGRAEAKVIKKEAKLPPAAPDKSESWYAVAHGRDGRQGVFQSLAEAAPLVNGVSRAVYQRFKTVEAAVSFIQDYRDNSQGEKHSGSGWWYGVFNSRTGESGVYGERSEECTRENIWLMGRSPGIHLGLRRCFFDKPKEGNIPRHQRA
jgi:hypothetical protein